MNKTVKCFWCGDYQEIEIFSINTGNVDIVHFVIVSVCASCGQKTISHADEKSVWTIQGENKNGDLWKE